MDTKKRFPFLNALLGKIVLASLFAACYPRDSYPDFTKDSHPIVFQLWGSEGENSGGLGIINADGTDLITFPNNLISRTPAWSPDGKKILVLHPWGSFDYGYMGLINQGTYCKEKGVFYERLRWGSDHEILRENIEHPEGVPYVREIVFWDINTCSISKILYREATTEIFKYFDYSAMGDVAFTRETKQGRLVAIYRSDLPLLYIIGVGFGATWSPDGMSVVYTGAEGFYIADREGRSIWKVVDLTGVYPVENGKITWDEWPPMAVWSPDGRHLLYHRKNGYTYDIVKFEIAAGLETVIYTGGMYPDWR